ncbi:hypothetical protein ACIOTN_05410 [Glutamicibacter sp. NPDC087661]|uniref:hypothetical protein n=1 Tax=Glutamicibacter sp. NPDC087661 TaxID=3363996 RepID=UPI00382FE911
MPDAPRKLLKLSSVAALAGCLALAGCGSTAGGTASQEPSSPEASPTQSASPTASSPGDAGESEQSGTVGGQELGKLPSSATEYADALVVAWGNGSEAQMQQLATDQVVALLTGHSAAGGPNWSQTGSDAGAGSVFVSYENADDGSVLNLRVQSQVVGQGQEQGVVEANFE